MKVLVLPPPLEPSLPVLGRLIERGGDLVVRWGAVLRSPQPVPYSGRGGRREREAGESDDMRQRRVDVRAGEGREKERRLTPMKWVRGYNFSQMPWGRSIAGEEGRVQEKLTSELGTRMKFDGRKSTGRIASG
jgi:hypothetical protein